MRCLPVCLSVCHTQISPKLSEIDIWLLLNANRKSEFLIQNLPSDSGPEVQFRRFGLFHSAGKLSFFRNAVSRCCLVSVATPPPSERVAQILGRDEVDEDDDHHTHEIFCELEELRLPAEDGELEWRETAR